MKNEVMQSAASSPIQTQPTRRCGIDPLRERN